MGWLDGWPSGGRVERPGGEWTYLGVASDPTDGRGRATGYTVIRSAHVRSRRALLIWQQQQPDHPRRRMRWASIEY